MGNTAGYLALNGAIASGSEAAIIPEIEEEIDQLAELINTGFRKTKNSAIVIVAEDPKTGGAMALAERVKKEFPQYDARVTILGHIQRGGSPTARDRILASKMGMTAVTALMEGQRNVMVGKQKGEYVLVPFVRAVDHRPTIERDDLKLERILSICPGGFSPPVRWRCRTSGIIPESSVFSDQSSSDPFITSLNFRSKKAAAFLQSSILFMNISK